MPGPSGGVGFRIDSVWAFLAVHGDGDEGIVGINTPTGWLPAVAADQERLHQLKPLMERMASAAGQRIRLVKFHTREEVEEYGPEANERG